MGGLPVRGKLCVVPCLRKRPIYPVFPIPGQRAAGTLGKPMTKSLESLRRRAKALKQAVAQSDPQALSRATAFLPDITSFSHANALHVVAREAGYESWPKLKFAHEAAVMSRAEKAVALKYALFLGKHWEVASLLQDMPDLGRENIGLQCALYDIEALREALWVDPSLTTKMVGVRSPILHLAFSKHFQGAGRVDDMLAVAGLLVKRGADVNDAYPAQPGSEDMLSALYGAIGHAGNMELARFLLENGANPNDNESLYHATELGHRDGVHLLLEHGADPRGTNALLRAMDFNDVEAVQMLLGAGADPNDSTGPGTGLGSEVIPALHHAARRVCSSEIVTALLSHNADREALYQGHTAYAFARVFGNKAMAAVLEQSGARTQLTPLEQHLARAADGTAGPKEWIDMALVTGEFRYLMARLVGKTGGLSHMQRLVAIGFDANLPEEQGMPPFHLAGWEGLPETLSWLLSLSPDMAHLNTYGGTLLSTIVHGAENCPQRAERDHLACIEMALKLGVALPRPMITAVASPEISGFLADWATRYPGQVVDDGVY